MFKNTKLFNVPIPYFGNFERANDFLNATFTVFVKELGSVCFWGELGLGTIGDWQHLYGERRFLNRRGCLNLMRRFSM